MVLKNHIYQTKIFTIKLKCEDSLSATKQNNSLEFKG
jgi:hypothetical protein